MQENQISQPHRIHTFGSLQVYRSDAPLFLRGEKSRSLLAYLVLHPRVLHRREMLADMLWPDALPERTRRNLSDVLYRLQKIIGTQWLAVESDTLAFQPAADLWVDVWEFDRSIAGKDIDPLHKAVELYGGDLLPEIYENWIIPERELRRSQYLSALETLCAHHEAQGKLQQALLYARGIILIEPLHEPAHQSYLRLLGRLRRFGEARGHYEYLQDLLRSELEAEPLPETRTIVQSLERERDLEQPPAAEDGSRSFVGRKVERATVLAMVERTVHGDGGMLAVEGEAGIGKSRLLREIAAGARWRGVMVLQGQASEIPGSSPFSPLAEALTPLINSPRGGQLEAALDAEIRGALSPLVAAWRANIVAQAVPAPQADRRFYHALERFAEILAALAPVVLALDDLHWADPVLWGALRAFASGFRRGGGLLILAYRRPDIEACSGWEIIRSWDREGLLEIVALEPFTVEEVAQLVRDATPIRPAEVHALTGGNPFFLNEWLAQPELRRPANENVISLRLKTLSPAARSVLESASILGESIPYRFWTELSDLSPLALASLTDELMAQRWLAPSRAGYAFTHDLIRAAVYTGIEPSRRRALHERAARAYETLEPDNARSYAFHLDHAGLLPEAVSAYRRAGEQDLARFAYREAQAAFERALILLPPSLTVGRIEIMLSLAGAYDILGEPARERALLEEAFSGARRLRDKPLELRALLAMGLATYQAYEYAEMEKHLLAALRLARRLGDQEKQADAYLLLGRNKTGLRHTRQSITYYKRALRLARKIASPSQEAAALRGLGIAARDMDALTESIKWLQQAQEMQRRIGDRLGEAVTQSNLVTTLFYLGAWDRLIAMAEEVLPRVEALGYRYNAGYLRHLQGLALLNLGDFSGARRRIMEAGKDFEAAGDKTAFVDDVLGLIAEEEGDQQEALRLYRKALAGIVAPEEKRETPILQLDLGALLWRLEQPHEAISYLEAARAAWLEEEDKLSRLKCEAFLGLARLKIGERSRAEELAAGGWTAVQAGIPGGEKPQGWLWGLHQLLTELDQGDAAQLVLRGTYEELQRQARAIGDSDLRRSFFTRVPLNCAIVAAYDQMTGTPRILSVSLAQHEASLGRHLRPDEYVTVSWTVNAPEDEAFADKTEQRHYRLQRLLREAEAQGAAPTDDDLAHALGVSRRTILRDMQTLSAQMPDLHTRKRKIKENG